MSNLKLNFVYDISDKKDLKSSGTSSVPRIWLGIRAWRKLGSGGMKPVNPDVGTPLSGAIINFYLLTLLPITNYVEKCS